MELLWSCGDGTGVAPVPGSSSLPMVRPPAGLDSAGHFSVPATKLRTTALQEYPVAGTHCSADLHLFLCAAVQPGRFEVSLGRSIFAISEWRHFDNAVDK